MSQYQNLVEEYKPHAIAFEYRVPYMYLDNKGYLTIGIGHLISKLDGSTVDKYAQSLSKGDVDLLRPGARAFSEEDLAKIMQDKSISDALNSTYALPFGTLNVAKVEDADRLLFTMSPLPRNICSIPVYNAFVALLKLSIKLKAEWLIAERNKTENPKGYRHTSFFSTTVEPGPNNLVISLDEMNKLYLEDATKKCENLKHYFSSNFYTTTLPERMIFKKSFPEWYKDTFKKEPEYTQWKGFDDFPKPVQLALLDMSYNLGAYGVISKFPYFSQLVREEKWDEVLKNDYTGKPSYCRSGKPFKKRNEDVGKWFQEANSMCFIPNTRGVQ